MPNCKKCDKEISNLNFKKFHKRCMDCYFVFLKKSGYINISLGIIMFLLSCFAYINLYSLSISLWLLPLLMSILLISEGCYNFFQLLYNRKTLKVNPLRNWKKNDNNNGDDEDDKNILRILWRIYLEGYYYNFY